MKPCKYFQQLLISQSSAELAHEEQALLQAHLQACGSCRKAQADLERIQQATAGSLLFEPDEAMLAFLRQRLSAGLHHRPQAAKKTLRFFHPAFQAAVALAVLAVGFGLGRYSALKNYSDSAMLEQLLAARQPIRTAGSEIDPYLGDIDKVRYDAATGMVDLCYRTVNNINYRGDLSDPLVKQLLQHAMTAEGNPATRLYAVKTAQALAQREQNLDADLLSSIEFLLKQEQNPGVRLMALRVLKSVPINEAIRNMLVRILLYDHNLALRMQAFESLTGEQPLDAEMEPLLKSVQSDSSTFIRYRANDLLKQIESKSVPSTSRELSREG
jgi:hypothetical protein